MSKYIVIAPVGDSLDALFVGLKDFLTEKIILLTSKEKLSLAEKTKKDLNKFSIHCSIVEVSGDIWIGMFKKIAELAEVYKEKNLIINTATGDKMTTCAATSAAFVNGLKAFSVMNGKTMLLPVLKFSYYNLLTDKKLKILEILSKEKNCCKSLADLAKQAKMSLPLISYHINGNLKSEGLVELSLVETTEIKRKVAVELTTLGKMLVKGYVK